MFADLLRQAGMRKADLARVLGITPNAIAKWRDNPPLYAVAYLEMKIERDKLRKRDEP